MSLFERPIKLADDDRLGFTALVENLSTDIRNTSTSSAWGVFGPWGSGKTSLLNLVRENLGDAVLWLHFDAWLFKGTDGVLVPLLQQLAELRPRNKTVARSLQRIVKAVVLSGSDLMLRSATGGMKLSEVINNFEVADEEILIPRCQSVELRSAFEDLVIGITRHRRSSPRKIIVAVDNLDRCRPDTALTTLDALSLFMLHDDCLFLLAADDAVLATFVSKMYEGTALDGWRFLEKVVPDYIRVPTPRPAEDYGDESDEVLHFLSFTLETVPHLQQHKQFLWSILAKTTALRNPRRMKRLVRQLSRLNENDLDSTTLNSVLFLVVLNDMWPATFSYLVTSDNQEWDAFIDRVQQGKATELPFNVRRRAELNEMLRSFAFEGGLPSHEDLWNALDLLRPLGI